MTALIVKCALFIYGIAMLCALFRLIKGPSLPDRVIAFDTVGIIIMSSVGILSVLFNTVSYLEAILIIAILAFISTVATSRFIERGIIFERKRNR